MKYNNKLTLTNPKSVPFALCNNFDNTFELIDKVVECKSAKEFCTVANNMHRYGRTWILDKDCDSETRLRSTDPFGNIKYLIAYKEDDVSSLSKIPTESLIMELISRGYKVSI